MRPGVFFSVLCLLSQSSLAAPLNGAGATFPYPLYSKWFSEFRAVDAAAEINYQSIGSGGGIRQLLDRTVDFGASDTPMTDEQLAKSATTILHFPTVLGAVVLTYNLEGFKTTLRLTPQVLSDIFMGKIRKWNDPKLVAENPGLPNLDIVVAHRSDGSGTTAIFTDYLAKASPEWKTAVGAGTAVQWPTGMGAKGNEGVTGLVKNTPGSIGYIELIYAQANNLPSAIIKNAGGQWIVPTLASVSAAARGVTIPEDFRVSLTNPSSKAAYPIAGFTYLLAYTSMNAEKQKRFAAFLNWALESGQKTAEALGYAPLPSEVRSRAKKRIALLKAE